MMSPIPYGKQDVTEEDILAVVETLKSDYLTQGPQIEKFEKAFAEYVGSKYAIAVSNGTTALHLSVLSLGLKPGEKVITTPITFAASANCILYCGGEVIFSDIDPKTYLIDLNRVEDLLRKDNKIRGIVPVDFAGRAVNLEDVKTLADKYHAWILEDSCHAPGGYFQDSSGTKQLCGNGQFADLSIFSFHPVKHIAAGEGGMITTNNEEHFQKLSELRTHGITRDKNKFQNNIEVANSSQNNSEYPGWYMEMQSLGYNYRLTDIQAALGLSQLSRADGGIGKRRKIAEGYYDAFKGKSWLTGQSGVVDGHAYHLYIIEVDNRLELYNHLRSKNVFAQVHYIPVHLMPYYQSFGWKLGDLPNAEKYYSRCLSIPMYPTLTSDKQEYIVQTINEFYDSRTS